jgi:hypothetical protein
MDIDDFKNGYKPRTNIVKDGKGVLVVDSHSVLPRWKNHFSQLLNVHGVKDVRSIEIHTPGSLVPEPSAFEVEMDSKELIHKSPVTDKIQAELIKAGEDNSFRDP